MRANLAVTTHLAGNFLGESCKYADCKATHGVEIATNINAASAATTTNTSVNAATVLTSISSHLLSNNSLQATSTNLNESSFTSNTTLSTFDNAEEAMVPSVPAYIRNTAMLLCITIMVLGIIGNIMVPIVIIKTKDMRNSTNIFLTNLSIADLLVLLVCTPTVLVEVNTRPETWILGHEMCKAVPFVELTVAHASVLTILAISFERYYAICEPLKAGYVCTKTRAILICMLAWGIAALFTSPIIFIATYRYEQYYDGTEVAVCFTSADTFWSSFYFIASITVFFALPFIVLVLLYAAIARQLLQRSNAFQHSQSPVLAASQLTLKNRHHHQQHHHQHQQNNGIRRNRKQVIYMLITVVVSFFICLLPFRAFTLWVISGDPSDLEALGVEGYYNLLYFCRVMLYLNSALNPILYNIMSSKFRNGFWRLLITCCRAQPQQLRRAHKTVAQRRDTNLQPKRTNRALKRHSTFINSSTSTSSSGVEHISWRSNSNTASTYTSLRGTQTALAASMLDLSREHRTVHEVFEERDIQAIEAMT